MPFIPGLRSSKRKNSVAARAIPAMVSKMIADATRCHLCVMNQPFRGILRKKPDSNNNPQVYGPLDLGSRSSKAPTYPVSHGLLHINRELEILGVLGVFEASFEDQPPRLEDRQESPRYSGKTISIPPESNRIRPAVSC